MRKLFRSLIAVGGLAGLVACGDDVSITPPPPPALTISGAPVTAIQVGAKVQLSANQAVTWSSSDATVASVDGTGLVTAVKAGVASITATSTADATQKASVTITVAALVNAAISIQNITVTGTPGNTVNVNNVAGSIDVNLNVVPGDQVVQRVEVLLDGNVACTQNLSGAQAAVSAEADVEGVDAVIVSCQINTAAFSTATGVASYFNGSHTLSARAVLVGGSQVATPSTPLVFNNNSGLIVTVTNDNGSSAGSAINPGTGLSWIGGAVTVNVVGVSYVSGTTVASVSGTIFGKTPVIALTSGLGSVTWTEGSSAWSGTNSSVTNYLSAAAESFVFVSATLSNGQPLVSPTPILNFGAPGTSNAAMPVYQVLRLDNTAPGAASANGVAQVAITIGAMAIPWVNASSSLAAAATSTNVLGISALSVLNAATAGAGNDVEEGVDAITVTVNVPAAGGSLSGSAAACSLTGLTAVTSGGSLTETTVSTAYPARIVFTDALGNKTCIDLAVPFGADFTAPTASVTAGPAANTGYNASPLPAWSVSASDNASGFDPLGALRVSVSRLNISGSTTCVLGSGSSCAATSQQLLSFDPTNGTNVDGYYTTTIKIQDQAGNSVDLVTAQLNGLDVVAPTFSGGISLPALIAGATTNTFTTSVADNLDLGSIYGVVAYPVGSNLQYPTQQIGTFGPALEKSSSNFGYAVANWIRCLNAAGSFATASGSPTAITLSVTDQTTVPATNTTSLASAAFGANAQTCTGSVGNIAAADINSFVDSLANYGGTKTQVDLDGASLATASSASVVLTAKADVALNSSADPFTRVDFYYQNTAGNLVLIGTGVATLAQTLTNRTYTYKFTWDPPANLDVAASPANIFAVGVDAQGDAVLTIGTTVIFVP
jgi:hypothetical protein